MNHKPNNRSVKFAVLVALSAILATLAGFVLLAAPPVPAGAPIPSACPVSVKVMPQLDDVTLIETTGIIHGNYTVAIGAEVPALVIVSGNESFELNFTSNAGLKDTAFKSVGKCVKVTGLLVKVGVEQPVHNAIDVDTITSAP